MKKKKIQFSKRVEYPEVYLGYQGNANCCYNDIIEAVFKKVNEYLMHEFLLLGHIWTINLFL